MTRETQYTRILAFLRKNKQATVRQLLQFTNYPSARIAEMTLPVTGLVRVSHGGALRMGATFGDQYAERIARLWTTDRHGREIRLFRLERLR